MSRNPSLLPGKKLSIYLSDMMYPVYKLKSRVTIYSLEVLLAQEMCFSFFIKLQLNCILEKVRFSNLLLRYFSRLNCFMLHHL